MCLTYTKAPVSAGAVFSGKGGRDRTCNLLVQSQALYRCATPSVGNHAVVESQKSLPANISCQERRSR